MTIIKGALRKMAVELVGREAHYALIAGEGRLALNAQSLGKNIELEFLGDISCIHCDRSIKKSFNQGYCFPCFKALARCDQCIVSPEKCHYHLGTCREPKWADQFCMQDHIVYLANSSGLKVGITRIDQVPTRWIDQGAVAALPIYRVSNRRISGLVEQACKDHVADKTNWRAMLKGSPEPLDLSNERTRIHNLLREEIDYIQEQEGLMAVSEVDTVDEIAIDFPVAQYPEKVTSLNFDKQALVQGELYGVKGQYLLLSSGVINLRKFAGYNVSVRFDQPSQS